MMIGTRWQKIINDIWGNKSRSMLVILSIAVGVGVVGMINNSRYMIERDLYGQYQLGNPASVSIYISPFQEDLSRAIEDLRAVEAAQPRRLVSAEITSGEVLEDISLIVTPDFDDVAVNQMTLQAGEAAPGLREIVLERQTAKALDLAVGDGLTVEMEDGSRYPLTVAGITQDIYELPYSITKVASGYVTMNTLQWMGEQPYYNRLDLVAAENKLDREHVLDVAAQARDRVIEPAGYYVGSIQIPGIDSDPGEHWAQNQIGGFVLILQVMSVMAIFLSGGLVVNTISAILTQQVKQIGIMRSIGAVPKQITAMYIFNIFVFSVVGWGLAIPLGVLGSYGLSKFAANFLNYTVSGFYLSPEIFLLQTLIAMLVPIGVALYPIIAGTSIKVYDAIYQQGLVNEGQKQWVESLVARLKFLSPPAVLSTLNTFRNLPRLAFTLATLTLAGATFVAAFSTRSSLNAQIEELTRYAAYDAAISVDGTASIHTALREAERIPGLKVVEGWARVGGILIREGNIEGEELTVTGLRSDTQTIDPKLLDGRWLADTDTWQVVANEDLTTAEDGVTVGSEIEVEVMGVTRRFQVVGITSKNLSGPRVYINYAMFSKLTGRNDQVNEVRVRLDPETISAPETQDAVKFALEEHMSNAGLSEATGQTQAGIMDYFSEPFGIILIVLVIMAGLLAVVGGLSLAGTMGINVMERTREIGVLRSVGASNGAIRQVVVVEGVMIAALSWLLAALISGPAGAAMAGAVINAVLKSKLIYSYSFQGLFIWLALIVVIGVVSSLTPARKAVMLTVREVLDYE